MATSSPEHFDLITDLPGRGDTVVGNDVWRSHGHARCTHRSRCDRRRRRRGHRRRPRLRHRRRNPARLIRARYDAADIARLLAMAWWDWPVRHITRPVRHITRHVRTIMSGTVADLERAAARLDQP